MSSKSVLAGKHVVAKFAAEFLILSMHTLLMSGQVGSSDKSLLAIVDRANVRSGSVRVVGL